MNNFDSSFEEISKFDIFFDAYDSYKLFVILCLYSVFVFIFEFFSIRLLFGVILFDLLLYEIFSDKGLIIWLLLLVLFVLLNISFIADL